MTTPALRLGDLYITRGASEALEESGQTPGTFLQRYLKADWGDCTRDDWDANDVALLENNRVHGVYHTAKGEELWIITEWDRSVTTILTPDEY